MVKGVNRTRNSIEPTTLNNTCVAAARRAAIDAPIEAKIAVMVVPILSPNNTGREASKFKIPSEYRPCKIPTVALELCTITVNTVPTTTPNIGCSLILIVKSIKAGNSRSGFIPPLINSIPKNKPPKPKITSPRF